MSNENKLTIAEEQTLIELLAKLEPGVLPKNIFSSIIRLIVTPTYLVVPLYNDNGILKVQLLDREPEDPYWPGQMALPGKIIIATDKTLTDVYNRLIQSEIPDSKIKEGPVFCGHVFEEIVRGREISLINYVILSEPPKQGRLYDINNLPYNIVETEIKRVGMAVKSYLEK